MSELDGYGVLSSLRQNRVTAMIPFIFLTAKSTTAEVRTGMKLGADDYLTKPTTAEELLGAIAPWAGTLCHRHPTGKTSSHQTVVRC